MRMMQNSDSSIDSIDKCHGLSIGVIVTYLFMTVAIAFYKKYAKQPSPLDRVKLKCGLVFHIPSIFIVLER